jgi:hypothetical protein
MAQFSPTNHRPLTPTRQIGSYTPAESRHHRSQLANGINGSLPFKDFWVSCEYSLAGYQQSFFLACGGAAHANQIM